MPHTRDIKSSIDYFRNLLEMDDDNSAAAKTALAKKRIVEYIKKFFVKFPEFAGQVKQDISSIDLYKSTEYIHITTLTLPAKTLGVFALTYNDVKVDVMASLTEKNLIFLRMDFDKKLKSNKYESELTTDTVYYNPQNDSWIKMFNYGAP